MSIWDIFRRKAATEPDPAAVAAENHAGFYAAASSSGHRGSELYQWMVDGVSSAGVAVNERTIMAVSAVYASVNLIGGAIACLPLHTYRRGPEGRARVDHDLWWLLNEQPNPHMSAAVWREYMLASLLLKGDSINIIQRVSPMSPRIGGFVPVNPDAVQVEIEGGRLQYLYHNPDTARTEVHDQDDVLHIPGPGFDGRRGKSQIRHSLRNAAGIALAADEYSAAFFRNGAKPDFAIELPGNPTADQQDMMRRTWSERYGGVTRSHLPGLLVGGAKIHEMTINAEDAQLISTRQFQVEDVARIFGVPPHLIGHTTAATSWGTGIEQMSIGFVKFTIARHLVKIEQEINRKCFRTASLFCEFNTAGLERGDYKTRMEGYRIALGRAGEPGWMKVNEVRKMENLPPDTDPASDALHRGDQPAKQPGGTDEK